jgi:hypothetical protein
MLNNLKQVNYSQFRHIISVAAGSKIKNKGKKTYVYDQNNHMLAALTTPYIDTFGRSRPTQYFIRH